MRNIGDALALPLLEIVRPASEYELAFKYRVARLTKQRPSSKGPPRDRFRNCAKLSQSCREKAISLSNLYLQVRQYEAKDVQFILNIVHRSLSSTLDSISDPTLREGVAATQNEAMNLYKQLLAANDEEKQDKTVNQWLEEHLASGDDLHMVGVKSSFVIVHHAFEGRKSAISTSVLIALITALAEGILYLGIFTKAGGSLDKQVAQDAVLLTLHGIASPVPLVGTAINARDFLMLSRIGRSLTLFQILLGKPSALMTICTPTKCSVLNGRLPRTVLTKHCAPHWL